MSNQYMRGTIPPASIDKLRTAVVSGSIRFDVPAAEFTRWQIGGPAAVIVEPSDIDELTAVLRAVAGEPYPLCIVGDGSNVLFDSAGFSGIVLVIGRRFSSIRIENERVTAGAGIATPDLARAVGHAGLTGIEHTIGIPGTLGGLVLMNGGSLRRSIGTNIESVRCIALNGTQMELSREECQFSYRSSYLQRLGAIVVEVILRLDHGEVSTIYAEMDRILSARAAKFPLDMPNCGSTFVSDPALYETVGPPGKAIESVGLKGTVKGGAQISEQHANFFVNLGHATSDDALWLIALTRNTVRAATGVSMECEVRYVSPDGVVRPAHEEAERRWGRDLVAGTVGPHREGI